MQTPKGYSATQIGLHWIVVALLGFQYLFNDAMGAAWRAFRRGLPDGMTAMAWAHILVGIAIFALVAWRLALRARRGAPALPEGGNPVLDRIAMATHALLYLLLVLIPVSGLVAWYGGVGLAAEAHEVMKTILLALMGLHIVGALYHQLVLRDGLMMRMKRPAD